MARINPGQNRKNTFASFRTPPRACFMDAYGNVAVPSSFVRFPNLLHSLLKPARKLGKPSSIRMNTRSPANSLAAKTPRERSARLTKLSIRPVDGRIILLLSRGKICRHRCENLARALECQVAHVAEPELLHARARRLDAALIVVDTLSFPGSPAILRDLRLASCHTPCVACIAPDFDDEDRLYESGFNALVHHGQEIRHWKNVFRTFIESPAPTRHHCQGA